MVCGNSGGIRHQEGGGDTNRLRSTPYHGNYSTHIKMLHTDAWVPCSLSHLNYMSQIVQKKIHFINVLNKKRRKKKFFCNSLQKESCFFFLSKFGPSLYEANHVGFTMTDIKCV